MGKQPIEEGLPSPVLASSSPSPDETVSSSTPSPPLDAFEVYQELLKRVAADLSVQAEEVRESSHHPVDMLSSVGPSRIALPVNMMISELIKALWQTSSSLLLTS